eukprot:gene26228-9035_t
MPQTDRGRNAEGSVDDEMEEDRTTPPTPSVLVKPTSQASLEQSSPLPVELDEKSAGKSMHHD